MNSDVSGFYALPLEKRLAVIRTHASLTAQETALLKKSGALGLERADAMIENVIGTTQLPLGIATNFLVNGKDYLVPMAIEEPSVVAAASYAAKLARKSGGFVASADPPMMIGQLQLVSRSLATIYRARERVLANKREIMDIANGNDSIMIMLGGGVKDIKADIIKPKPSHIP